MSSVKHLDPRNIENINRLLYPSSNQVEDIIKKESIPFKILMKNVNAQEYATRNVQELYIRKTTKFTVRCKSRF